MSTGGTDLRSKVRSAYSSAAEAPDSQHPFPVGRAFAESLGYPPAQLANIPPVALDAFAGVSNVACFAEVPINGTVLDLGCGAGLDSLLMAARVGKSGRVIGMDFSWSMLQRARCAAVSSRTTNVSLCQAEGERLPLGDGVVDMAIVNGIFNLNPARDSMFRELARCHRPGGRLFGAELILREALPPEARVTEENWFA